MRDDELRSQLAAWVRPLEDLPAPGIAVIRRRIRRRITRTAVAGLATLAVVAVPAVLAIHSAGGPAPAAAHPSTTAAPPHPSTQPPPVCSEQNLRITAPESTMQSTMPGVVAAIFFRNTGPGTCALEGWPKLAVLGPDGLRMQASVVYGTANGTWVVPVTRVVLRPGAKAAVSLLIGVPATVGGCRTSWAWAVTPPGGRHSTVVHERPGGYGPCPGDTVEVSPLRPGSIPLVGIDSASPVPGAPTAGLFTTPPQPQGPPERPQGRRAA